MYVYANDFLCNIGRFFIEAIWEVCVYQLDKLLDMVVVCV